MSCSLIALPADDPGAGTHLRCETCHALIPVATLTTPAGSCPPRVPLARAG